MSTVADRAGGGTGRSDRQPAPARTAIRERYTSRTVGKAALDLVVESGNGYLGTVPRGGHLRVVDLHGNQSVEVVVFDDVDVANRYSAFDTIREQGAVYLTRGSVLLSSRLDPLATIVTDSCGRHDTLGGACSQEGNLVRYGEQTRHQHACRETFLHCGAPRGIGARELTASLTLFGNVPVTADGGLSIAEGAASPGRHVELRAERDLLVLLSCCPQLNDPRNGWNPTPVRLLGWW